MRSEKTDQFYIEELGKSSGKEIFNTADPCPKDNGDSKLENAVNRKTAINVHDIGFREVTQQCFKIEKGIKYDMGLSVIGYIPIQVLEGYIKEYEIQPVEISEIL